MAKLQVGRTYSTREGLLFTITKTVAPDTTSYGRGYRFQGVSADINSTPDFITNYTVMWDGNGSWSFGMPNVSSTYDLTHEIVSVSIHDIVYGESVGDMHMHEVGKGSFSAWKLTLGFEISRTQFQGMYNELTNTAGRPFGGKQGYIVSATENDDGNVTAILIIYEYDGSFRCATLVAPEPKRPL
jgi:hypothetical protein